MIDGVPTGRIGSGSSKNRQAVAEFQGQTMNSTDLKNFFKAYVKDAQPGDDTVSKVGRPTDRSESANMLPINAISLYFSI